MRAFLKAIAHNWKLKLLAFAMAMLLWVMVSAEQITSQWMRVPLDVEVHDARWDLVAGSVPTEVAVRFVGPARELLELTIDRPRVMLRINRVDDITQAFGLDPSMVRTPRALSISPQDIRPARLQLQFDRVETRELPVRVEIGRGPRPPYALVDTPVVNPARVLARGPAALIAQIGEVLTQPVDLSREDTVFHRQVRLRPPPGTEIRFEPDVVTVSGQLDRIVERVVQEMPVDAVPGAQMQPSAVELRLRGIRSSLAALPVGELRVRAALDTLPARLPEAGLLVPLRVERLPRGISAEVVPDTTRLFPSPLPADTAAVAVPPDVTPRAAVRR